MSNLINFITNCYNKISNKTIIHNDEDIAQALFDSLNVGHTIPDSLISTVNQMLNDCKTRQDILNKIIDLTIDANTPHKRYLLAMANIYSGAKYRQNTIHYINLYLNNPLYEDAWKHIHHDINNTLQIERNLHISKMYSYLGKAYEGEYQFQEALNAYQTAIKFDPASPLAIIDSSNILVKMNQLNEALTFLKSFTNSPYYVRKNKKTTLDGKTYYDNWYKSSIDNAISDVKAKIKNGYKYKPRKKKQL